MEESPGGFQPTKFYCEENVYMYLKSLESTCSSSSCSWFACFISNQTRAIPLWSQKSTGNTDDDENNHHNQPVVWDYHVIAIEKRLSEAGRPAAVFVYDFDSTLPFPCDAQLYLEKALRHREIVLKDEYKRWFRLIPRKGFLEHFASDRSHMVHIRSAFCLKYENSNMPFTSQLRGDSGGYQQPSPLYPCITSKTSTNNLQLYIEMQAHGSEDVGTRGRVFQQEEFIDFIQQGMY